MATQLRGFQVADAAISTAKIANGAVTNAKIGSGAVDAAKIAANAVTTVKIADANITEAKIADLAVTNGKIAAEAVDTAKIAADAVTEVKIAAGSVTNAKVAANAITDVKIADGAVATTKLQDEAVTLAKIADSAVNGSKIADNSIGTSHIVAGAVTYDKLDAAVQAKLDNTLTRVLDATRDPDADDDSANTGGATWSYGSAAQVGSMWVNTTTGETFRCVDASVGAAVWVQTSIDSTELSDLAFISQATLETTIQVSAISQVTGLQAALDAKASLAGNNTFSGVNTFDQTIVGQISDLSNHIGDLTNGQENKYVDAAELKAKFDAVQTDLDSKQSAFLAESDYFDGDGSTTSFTYGASGDTNLLVLVFRNGQKLKPVEDYTDNNEAISFASAPESGEIIEVSRIYQGN